MLLCSNSCGLRTNLLTLNSPSLIGWMLLIIAVAVLGKFLDCGIATRNSIVVGALMNTRGLTELVILSIGLSLGVLSDPTFAMMVIMALATTVMAAPIVNRLIKRDEMVPVLIGPAEAGAAALATRVLVALGNPLNAAAIVDAAIRLTGARRPAELLLPPAYQLGAGIVEGIAIYLLDHLLRIPVTLGVFLVHYSLVWVATFLASQSTMRILFPRWRYRGGQVL